jgi:hypothetical protein
MSHSISDKPMTLQCAKCGRVILKLAPYSEQPWSKDEWWIDHFLNLRAEAEGGAHARMFEFYCPCGNVEKYEQFVGTPVKSKEQP